MEKYYFRLHFFIAKFLFKVTRYLCFKIRPLLHIPLNKESVDTRPLSIFKYGLVTETLKEMCKGGLIFIYFSSIHTK